MKVQMMPVRTVRGLIEAVESWLLSPQAQLADGPQRGGIVGWLDEEGAPVFMYPESTGYYLTWLAFISETPNCPGIAAAHAVEALSWLSLHFSDGRVPPTRIYLNSVAAEDWRNTGAFSFDLAMLARGTAQHLSGSLEGKRLLARLFDLLLPFCGDDGSFQAFRPHTGFLAPARPPGWSCSRGPYQTKLAAAIMLAGTMLKLPSRLRDTAEMAYRHWREYSRSHTLDGNAHPALYHLEGLSLAAASGWDPDAWGLARDAYLEGIWMPGPSYRLSAPFNRYASQNRSDVLAQALRLGCIIQSKAGLREPGLDRALHQMAWSLQTFVNDEGAVLFSHHGPNHHRNAWSAMVTHQALSFYEAVASGNPVDDRWQQLLV